MKVEFLDTFITGHPEIDDDHRKMVADINAVSAAIKAEKYDLCATLLDHFLKTCSDHFANEEALLSALAYPGVADHAVFHKDLLIKANAIKSLCMDRNAPDSIRRCFDEMATLLVEDVVRGDLQFVSFLIEKGVVEPRIQLDPLTPLAPRRSNAKDPA